MSESVVTGQGTRLSEKAPWETYDDELDVKLTPQLQDDIARLEERRHDHSSSENEEELCRQREVNDGIAEQYRWVSPDEYEDLTARIGRVMHSNEFITRLRKVGVQCWYRDHPLPGRITLLYSDRMAGKAPEVGCWVQHGYMPEFSIMRFDDHGVPLDERRRGWRTCLLQLILKGVISWYEVNQEFGEAKGPAAERYNTTLFSVHNDRTDQEEF